MSALVNIADALVAALRAQRFSQPLEALRAYVPAQELKDLGTAHVTVVPRAFRPELTTRAACTAEFALDLGIQKRVAVADLAELDACLDLVEEICVLLRTAAPCGLGWTRLENDPVFAREHLLEKCVFTSLVTVTYQGAWA